MSKENSSGTIGNLTRDLPTSNAVPQPTAPPRSPNNISYLLTYLLTPWCRVLLEKLIGLELVKKFPAFHGTRWFIIALTSVRHLSLSWASPIQSISHLLEINPNIIHPSTPRSSQWSLSLRLPYQDPIRPPLLTHTRHMPSPSHSSRFYHPHNIGWEVQII